MHSTLFLAGAILQLLGGALGLGLLRRLGTRPGRRAVQGLILAAPLAGLVAIGGAVGHFAGRDCFLRAPRWDRGLAPALVSGVALLAFGGLALGGLRLALLGRVVGRRGLSAGRELEGLVARLAARAGVPPPRVLVCTLDRPLALVCGLRRPTVLLSTWMPAHLDRPELEAVLAHELAHIARRDYLAAWLATVLRDAFCYLPASRIVQRQLQRERELACDDVAVAFTGRPLALASALVKVWQPALGGPRLAPSPALVGDGAAFEERIARLLAAPAPSRDTQVGRSLAVAVGPGLACIGLLVTGALTLVGGLALLGCGPASALGWAL
jgi:Zn-dependent protease with chaperone function